MSEHYRVETPTSIDDCAPFADILAVAFGATEADALTSLDQPGLDHIRLVHDADRMAGGLKVLPMGQYFGGRSVPTAGIAAVAVAPAFRGRGAARVLMETVLREQHAAGRALSTLYPATVTLYRRCGYELAGGRYTVRLSPRTIGPIRRDCDVAPLGVDDRSVAEQLYASWAAHRNGYLDRSAYLWTRVHQPRRDNTRGFLFSQHGRPEGYLYYIQRTPALHDQQLDLPDLVAASPEAAAGALAFLADHRSLVGEVTWHTGPADPLLMLLSERHFHVELEIYWMLRLVHLPKALEARGYPVAINTDLHLDVQDNLLAENAGRWLVTIRDGRAVVRRGGDGRIQCDIRGLAALYTGFQTTDALTLTGQLKCPSEDAAIANAVFIAAPPAMADLF